MDALKTCLTEGIQRLDLQLDELKINQLMAYLNLFIKWNHAYNLSAIRDPLQMVTKHLLDSLAVYPFIEGGRMIDVGTGGGLPGIPLAICYPEKHFTLLDSAGKKTRFLFQVKQQLALENVEIHNGRAENFEPDRGYDQVISRAFASLLEMTRVCQHLLLPEGSFLAMKGVFPEDELSQLEKHYIVDTCHPLRVPGLEGERCLLVLKRDCHAA